MLHKTLTYLRRDGSIDPQKELEDAILEGDVLLLEKSLENGANINRFINGTPPLTLAIKNGEEDVAIGLIEYGSDISVEPIIIQTAENKSSGSPAALSETISSPLAGVALSELIQFAFHEICRSLLNPARWPNNLHPILGHTCSQSLFGFCIRHFILKACFATYHRDFKVAIWPFVALAFSSTFHFTFQGAPPTDLHLSQPWKLSTITKRYPQFVLWSLGAFIYALVGRFLWLVILALFPNLKYVLNRRQKGVEIVIHGGTDALRTIINSTDGSERVCYTLLIHGIFSEDYVQQSIQRQNTPPGSDVIKLWEWALLHGHHRVCVHLLGLGISPAQSISGGSSLECAASFGHEDILKALFNAAHDGQSLPPEQINLAFAANAAALASSPVDDLIKRRTIFNILLTAHADINSMNRSGRTCLSYLVEAGIDDLVELLLQQGANVNLANDGGKTLLWYLKPGRRPIEICSVLIRAGADANHISDNGYTALLEHARRGHTDIVQALLAAKADPRIATEDGRTALHFASQNSMISMMQDLLDAGVIIDALTSSSATPLIFACHCHYMRADALYLLLRHGANPNALDCEGRSPLHIVCSTFSSSLFLDSGDDQDQLRSIQALIEYGANVNATYTEHIWGQDLETSAVGLVAERLGSEKYYWLRALLHAGASPHGVGRSGKQAVVSACRRGPGADSPDYTGDCVKLLLDAGASLEHRDELGMTLLHHAADGGNFHSLAGLLERGASVTNEDSRGRTPLHIACEDSSWMLTENYLKWEAAGMYGGSEEYRNWHCSIESTLILTLLFAAGARPTVDDNHGCTPGHIAAKAGNPRTMAMLLLNSGPLLIYGIKDSFGRLPFHYAVNSPEVTRVLLHYHCHNTVLSDRYFEVRQPLADTMAYLINTSVHNIMERLEEDRYEKEHLGEIIDKTDHPLSWRRGLCNSKDKFGNTPLHYAALIGNVAVVEQFLKLPDIDPNVCNDDGESPYDFALESRECGLAIAKKLSQLGLEVKGNSSSLTAPHAKSRMAAAIFIRELQRKYTYGVYSD
ncbi:hypothetical protein TWF481_001705 [Arthrobotrys musiformis]|uniref:Uncharacterized protein n=1 Tax=Arthrobotrys musiformis TaxID=47236 RepID=A0AAV9VWW8_9PEZI